MKKGYLAGFITLLAILFVPVFPKGMLFAYQIPVGDQSLVDGRVPTFKDTDGSGKVSVAVFKKTDGTLAYEQIPNFLYEKMGTKEGQKYNPIQHQSLFDALATPTDAKAAIAYVNSLQFTGTGTSITQAYTVSAGSNEVLLIGVDTRVSNALTGVSYNSVSMTQIQTTQAAGNGYLGMYYVLGPSSGSHNFVFTLSTSRTIYATAAEYSGVAQMGQPDNSTVSSGAGSGSPRVFTTTLTVNTNNAWTVLVGQTNNDTGLAANTGSTRRDTSIGTNVAVWFDSNAALTTGSQSMSIQQDVGGSDTFFTIMASLVPFGATSASFNLWQFDAF